MKGRVAAGILAGAASAGLHLAGLAAFAPDPAETLAGGAEQVAMIGNSFEDAVAGRLTPIPQAGSAERIAASTVDAEAARASNDASGPSPAPVASPAPAADRVPPAREPAVPTAAYSAARPVVAMPPATSEPLRDTDPDVAAVPAPERIVALDAPVAQSPTESTPRPQPRSAGAGRATGPAPEPRATRPAEPPAPSGAAPQATQTGQASGQARGNAARDAQGGTDQGVADAGAVARYPQRINRHLSRLRRPNARFDGETVVSFTISEAGGLAALSVARSSGNAEFDGLALSHIRRAVPFPAPPAGARRTFSVTILGR